MDPLISIIILNYNAGNFLLNCVDSVFKSKYTNYEVIVVDNVSKDNSQKICKEKFPKIILIENESNLGYCEGNNIGLKHAQGEFVVILNPDTIVESDWLNHFLDAHNIVGDGLYQPKILSLESPKTLLSTGNMQHIFGFGFPRDRGLTDNNQHNEIEKVGYASGTCLFTSMKVLKKIGFLDDFLFLYHDDLELGWRAAHLGINSYYVPKSRIFHAESYALKWSAEKFYWLERNRKYCIKTHYSKKTYRKILPYLLLVDFFVWVFYFSKGFPNSKIRAEREICRNKKRIKEKYEELEDKKIKSDLELINFFPNDILIPGNLYGGKSNKFINKIIVKLSQKAKNALK
ncbi:glycosyltransferase family 2 protein [Nitrosopumilus sp.]|uniref:glycosyltransferase family 2 protein n=1 Tax=Nitrosopumilus sp. TaxID=2024843 RepID=UPI003D0E4D8B